MEYYNEQDIPNHKVIKIKYLNHYKNTPNRPYIHSSTDNIFLNKNVNNLHKIYNKFLVNPYLIRNSRYQNAVNDYNQSQEYKYNKFFYYNKKNEKRNFSEENEDFIKSQKPEFNIPYSYETNHKSIDTVPQNEGSILPNIKNNQSNNDNSFQKDEIIFHPKIKNIINNEENKNIYQEEYKTKPLYNKNEQEFPQIKNNLKYNTIERPIEYNINHSKNSDNDIYLINNRNKLSLSYDIKNRKNKRIFEDKQYISPIIAKIAKHNYLIENPYTNKEENLGPSMLKNNPILYPINTYKFDFDRYIRGFHVNKFV
jgi:hypothetical protein